MDYNNSILGCLTTYKKIGKSAMRSVAHRARGKRILNKQLVGNANSLL